MKDYLKQNKGIAGVDSLIAIMIISNIASMAIIEAYKICFDFMILLAFYPGSHRRIHILSDIGQTTAAGLLCPW